MSNETYVASIRNTIAEIEAKMAEKKVVIEAIDVRIAPVDAEIDAVVAQQQALEALVQALVPKLAEARGMPTESYLELKRSYGRLAAMRMQLRDQLKETGEL